MSKSITPSLGLTSYSCPHCSALASQSWFRVFIDPYQKGERPYFIDQQNINRNVLNEFRDEEDKRLFGRFLDRFSRNTPTFQTHRRGSHLDLEMINLTLGQCYSCDAFTIWVNENLNFPSTSSNFDPAPDMPADVRLDFEEAAAIFSTSPRAAAAMLRLAVQRLMPHLDEKGTNLNDDIKSLVKKGLDTKIQQALDIVRVIGNNAVHPGQIDLNDDRATAQQLFALVNIIVQAMISQPKQINQLFGSLPDGARKQIEKRDG